MLFWILLIAIILLSIGGSILTYKTSDYSHGDNAAGVFFATLFAGVFVGLMIMLGAGSAVNENPSSRVIKGEKTYTLAEGSTPIYKAGELSFSYTENGAVLPYKEYVDSFDVGMEKPKGFKITEYDTIDKNIAPWTLGDGTEVEVIK